MNKRTVFLSGVLTATCAMFLFSTIVRAEIVTAESGDNMWSWVAYNDGAGRPNSNGLRLINEDDVPDPSDKIYKAIFIIQDINKKLSEQTSGVAGNQITAIYDSNPNLIISGKDYWLPNSEFINDVLSQYGSGDQYAMRGDSDYDSNIDAILKDPDFLKLYADQTGRDKQEVFDAMGVTGDDDDDDAACDGLVGSWRWFNGATVTCSQDGTCTASNGFHAKWSCTDPAGRFEIQWSRKGKNVEFVDSMSLSGDGQNITGKNQFGGSVSASRKP